MLNGAVGYSNKNNLSGGVSITDVIATLPNLRPLRASGLQLEISPDHIRFDPAMIESEASGALKVGGDYDLANRRSVVSLSMEDFPVAALAKTSQSWFGVPPGLSNFKAGNVSGQIAYARGGADTPSWSGQFRFADATLSLPGFAAPLTDAQGRIEMDDTRFTVDRFSGHLGKQLLNARYHFNALLTHAQRLSIDMPAADLSDLEAALEPTLQAQSFFARLGVTRRAVPGWLARRDLQGDLTIRGVLNQWNQHGTTTHALRLGRYGSDDFRPSIWICRKDPFKQAGA